MMGERYLVRIPIGMEALVHWSRERGWAVRNGRYVDFDEGEAVHHLVGETVGPGVLRPFRLLKTQQSSEAFLYAYSEASADVLGDTVDRYAGPEHLQVLSRERIEAKPLPSRWTAGQRVGFDLRARPVRRLQDRIEGSRGRVYPRGAEIDAWICDRLRPGHWKHEAARPAASREEAYLGWLAERLSNAADLDRAATRLVRYRHAHARRRRVVAGPDATFHGTLTITEPDAFTDILRRGVGRHCGYGYGMLLLRPPRGRG